MKKINHILGKCTHCNSIIYLTRKTCNVCGKKVSLKKEHEDE